MAFVEGIPVNLSVVLGMVDIPIRQVLRMGRGTTIPLNCGQNDPIHIHVGDEVVAEGRIVISDERMLIEVTRVKPSATAHASAAAI
jgi:flagellar motor switch protein FliN/FliY